MVESRKEATVKKTKGRGTHVVGAVLVGALLGGSGAPTSATAAFASPVASAVAAPVSAASAPRVSGLSAPAAPVVPGQSEVPAPADRGASTEGLPIKPVVDWVKRNAPSILAGMKNAVRGGWNAFKNWWNGLAGWIRVSISTVAQMSLNEVFSALWHYFFG